MNQTQIDWIIGTIVVVFFVVSAIFALMPYIRSYTEHFIGFNREKTQDLIPAEYRTINSKDIPTLTKFVNNGGKFSTDDAEHRLILTAAQKVMKNPSTSNRRSFAQKVESANYVLPEVIALISYDNNAKKAIDYNELKAMVDNNTPFSSNPSKNNLLLNRAREILNKYENNQLKSADIVSFTNLLKSSTYNVTPKAKSLIQTLTTSGFQSKFADCNLMPTTKTEEIVTEKTATNVPAPAAMSTDKYQLVNSAALDDYLKSQKEFSTDPDENKSLTETGRKVINAELEFTQKLAGSKNAVNDTKPLVIEIGM